MQSIGLALKGADGKSYTFRTLDKDPTKILPAEWRDSLPARIFQDQTAASHPGSFFMVPPLAEAVGIPHSTPQYVYIPDDPALGEFLEAFGGKAGTIEEYPLPAGEGYAGFMGATEILSTGKLWERWLAGEGAIDTEAFLRARLFDLFIGDWDRHSGQWRWMKLPGRAGYVPLPEDRDQAFSNYSGAALHAARAQFPRLAEWRHDYDNLEGLLSQGREIDPWLLASVSHDRYAALAKDVQGRLTDAVIESAVRRLPPEWYAKGGAELVRDLEKRRDLLPEAADGFYRELAKWVDVEGTNQDEEVRLTREADGSAILEVARAGPDGRPGPTYFSRRFTKSETKEIRIYLYEGNDRFRATGPRGGITVRVASGKGADRLDDSASGGTRFYDVEREGEVVKGPGTGVATAEWTRRPLKPETPWLEQRDWGTFSLWQPLVWWEPDPGVVLKLGFSHYTYGFRKQPYATAQTFGLEWKTARGALNPSYRGDFRWSRPGFHNEVELWLDGARNYGFYGFGNETPSDQPVDFYEADQRVTYAFPSLVSYETRRRTLGVSVGPQIKYSQNKAASSTLIGQDQPYGFGNFGQAGARIKVEGDTRGRRFPGPGGGSFTGKLDRWGTGLNLELNGYYYPKAWDVKSAFGAADGFVVGTWQPARRLILATRVGGRRVWGDYPWGDSAFIGGKDSARGYRRNRFAGDASFFANAEARLEIGHLAILLPFRFGIFGLADTGRVWLDGETSNKWHQSWGGGIFLRLMPLDSVVYAAAATGDEGTRFYVDYGFSF
jgi:hypothetical protein